MPYVRSFLPWIAFATITGWQWGSIVGLAIAAYTLIEQLTQGVTMDALILDMSTVAYFAVLCAISWTLPDSDLKHYVGAASMAWLGITAWATLALKRPFTTGIARRSAPPKLWNNPVFLRINVTLTIMWATAFTVTAVALATVAACDAGSGVSISLQIIGFIIPAVFTARYPSRVQARYGNRKVPQQ